MRVVRVQSPSPDDVFKKWLESKDSQTLSRLFSASGVVISRSDISAADNVKSVERHLMGVIRVKTIPTHAMKLKEKVVNYKQLERVTFYAKETSEDVPILKTLKLQVCDKCNGGGEITCKTCGGEGYITCERCGGAGQVTCERCGGTGKIKIEVKYVLPDKKAKKEINIPCPECHGKKKVRCPECHGLGRVVCPDCGGRGGEVCDKCLGAKALFQYQIGPILEERVSPLIVYHDEIPPHLRNKMVNRLGDIGCIEVKSSRELGEKELVKYFGLATKEIKETIRKLARVESMIKKSKEKKIVGPIILFPILKLYIETPKNIGFEIWAIGTKDKYIILEK